jgi:hypothetical protein
VAEGGKVGYGFPAFRLPLAGYRLIEPIDATGSFARLHAPGSSGLGIALVQNWDTLCKDARHWSQPLAGSFIPVPVWWESPVMRDLKVSPEIVEIISFLELDIPFPTVIVDFSVDLFDGWNRNLPVELFADEATEESAGEGERGLLPTWSVHPVSDAVHTELIAHWNKHLSAVYFISELLGCLECHWIGEVGDPSDEFEETLKEGPLAFVERYGFKAGRMMTEWMTENPDVIVDSTVFHQTKANVLEAVFNENVQDAVEKAVNYMTALPIGVQSMLPDASRLTFDGWLWGADKWFDHNDKPTFRQDHTWFGSSSHSWLSLASFRS